MSSESQRQCEAGQLPCVAKAQINNTPEGGSALAWMDSVDQLINGFLQFFASIDPFNVLVLPPEVWIMIFELLNLRQLKQVRLTCRTWYQIVGNTPSLMDKFVVKVVRPGQYDRIRGFAESSSRYTTVELWGIDFEMDRYWQQFQQFWELLRESLHSLILDSCKITFNDAFVLENLKTLSLRGINSGGIESFSRICPRLNELKIGNSYREQNEAYDQSIINLVQATRATLRRVHLEYSDLVFEAMIRMEGLQLSHVTVDPSRTSYANNEAFELRFGQLARCHPTIEHLDIKRFAIEDTATLVYIGKSLPNLRCLKVRPPQQLMGFLSEMPQLDHLVVDAHRETLSFPFNEFKCNVRHLTIRNLSIYQNIYQQHFPKMSTIFLDQCSVPRFTTILELITKTKSLQRLYIRTPYTLQDLIILPVLHEDKDVSNLRVLKIAATQHLDTNLLALFVVCPALEELSLACPLDGPAIFRGICKHLKRLRVLSITNFDVTEDCLRYLVANPVTSLRRFNLCYSHKLTEGQARELLKELHDVELYYDSFNRSIINQLSEQCC